MTMNGQIEKIHYEDHRFGITRLARDPEQGPAIIDSFSCIPFSFQNLFYFDIEMTSLDDHNNNICV